MGVKASELDALIWYEMQASSSTVFSLIENMRGQPLAKLRPRSSRAKTASPVPARRPSSFNPEHQSWPVMPSGQNCIPALRQQAPSALQEHRNRAKQGYQHLNILLTFSGSAISLTIIPLWISITGKSSSRISNRVCSGIEAVPAHACQADTAATHPVQGGKNNVNRMYGPGGGHGALS